MRNEIVLMCAFRYALGRMTYVVGEVADTIAAVAVSSEGLSRKIKDRMVAEITHAEMENGLGMEMDAKVWLRLRDLLSSKSNTEV